MSYKRTTSVRIDPQQWKEVRKASIDEGITTSEFVYRALKDKLTRTKVQ
ncbi:MAG: hypothetical protein WBE34_06985 [Candidatus Nitrosopolaris sp.]